MYQVQKKRGDWVFGLRIISMLMEISSIVIELMSLAAFVKPLAMKAKQMLAEHRSSDARLKPSD